MQNNFWLVLMTLTSSDLQDISEPTDSAFKRFTDWNKSELALASIIAIAIGCYSLIYGGLNLKLLEAILPQYIVIGTFLLSVIFAVMAMDSPKLSENRSLLRLPLKHSLMIVVLSIYIYILVLLEVPNIFFSSLLFVAFVLITYLVFAALLSLVRISKALLKPI